MSDEHNEHTPGPWHYDGQAYIFGPKTEMIAMIRGTGEGLPEDANARLLAAAPDLLAACKMAVNDYTYSNHELWTSTCQVLLDAIAKAEGK
jgi:hypothetical protein